MRIPRDRRAALTAADRPRAWLAAALLLASIAHAQPGLPPGVRGPMAGAATRSVSRYLDLERNLQEALAGRDRSAVKGLLAEDFEARTFSDADGLGADEWLRRETAAPARRRVRELAVHEADDIAVASFILEGLKTPGAASRASTLFVVDIWRQSTGKLLARYVDRPSRPPVLPDRPSGKE